MSEERFIIEESENQLIIFDNGVSDETYFHLGNDERDVKYVCGLLNEQQFIIDEQKIAIDEMITDYKNLEKNFEDLVNWSSEISKRNVLLDEKIGRLQQENKELKNKLNKGL